MNWNIRAVPGRKRFLVRRPAIAFAGELTMQGAKNSTLPLLAAALLCEGETVLHNCPALSDVHTAVTILRRLGCRCTHTGDTLTVCADGMTRCDIPHSLMREMRSSIVFLGAILSAAAKQDCRSQAGCELGPRPSICIWRRCANSAQKFAKSTLPVVHRARRVARRVRLACVPKRRRNGNLLLAAARAKGTTGAHKRRA